MCPPLNAPFRPPKSVASALECEKYSQPALAEVEEWIFSYEHVRCLWTRNSKVKPAIEGLRGCVEDLVSVVSYLIGDAANTECQCLRYFWFKLVTNFMAGVQQAMYGSWCTSNALSGMI
jgi:hypothetical protein